MAFGKPQKICPHFKSTGRKGAKRFLKRVSYKLIRRQKIDEDSPSKIRACHHGWAD